MRDKIEGLVFGSIAGILLGIGLTIALGVNPPYGPAYVDISGAHNCGISERIDDMSILVAETCPLYAIYINSEGPDIKVSQDFYSKKEAELRAALVNAAMAEGWNLESK